MRRLMVLPAILVVGLVVALTASGLSGSPSRLTASRLATYERALTPAMKDGGATVQQGVKPAIDDLVRRHILPAADIAAEADRWASVLEHDRALVADVAAPSQLRAAQHAFLAAFDSYVAAARNLGRAARSGGSERSRWLDEVYAAGQLGDKTYDEASRDLQQARHALGLPSNPDFPEGR